MIFVIIGPGADEMRRAVAEIICDRFCILP